jgi:hypothetical protein
MPAGNRGLFYCPPFAQAAKFAARAGGTAPVSFVSSKK